MTVIREGDLLWQPPAALAAGSNLARYMEWLRVREGRGFASYADLWEWSVADVGRFWRSIAEFFAVDFTRPAAAALGRREMPGAEWFPGAELNYAAHVFRMRTGDRPAIVFRSETLPQAEIGWDELERQVAAVAAWLRARGVVAGDRVAAFLPNVPEAVVAFLACASIGAIWSSCAPDFGAPSVLDRFRQIGPKVLFATDGCQYGGKRLDKRPVVAELRAGLPTVDHTILVPCLEGAAAAPLAGPTPWAELLAAGGPLAFEPVPFAHPLWIVYSSGTTGLPKPIVHGHGGILLEHLKTASLHFDLGPADRFFWFTTTGWMMWNFLLAGLLVGSPILLYDGSPSWPRPDVLWEFAAASGMTFFGTGAAYVAACMKAGLHPAADHDLSRLRGLGSTGSPLAPEGFRWVYDEVGRDLWLVSFSGGTDLCTGFVGGAPVLPVRAGEIQCRCLGADIRALDPAGRELVGEVGELVIAQPMPSMPVCFWGDAEGRRYRESYFEHYPGIWRHGDWMKLTPDGGVVIYGRSDATINRFGVRIGTSEIYRAVEAVPEVADSLVIDLEGPGGAAWMPLFVVLAAGAALDEPLVARIKARVRAACSPRHVPDEIVAIAAVPRTLSGKKLEVPVKKILLGARAAEVASPDALANPQSLAAFEAHAARLRATGVLGG
ncbi:MAG: acetoacetate--CoA ligase [Planctomycetia bacterium]